jgi:hypothetical protein
LGFATLDKVKKPKPSAVTPRRLPPPWSVEELDACYVVRDHSGQATRASRKFPPFLLSVWPGCTIQRPNDFGSCRPAGTRVGGKHVERTQNA